MRKCFKCFSFFRNKENNKKKKTVNQLGVHDSSEEPLLPKSARNSVGIVKIKGRMSEKLEHRFNI